MSGEWVCINEGTDVEYRCSPDAPHGYPGCGFAAPERGADVTPARRLDGAALIAAERERQLQAEGWTPEHDDEHAHGELAAAAVSYIVISDPDGAGDTGYPEEVWPWDLSWFKPADPIKNLVRAGALIAAEIDRLQRAQG